MIDETRPVFDRAAFEARTCRDRALQLEMVRMFLEDYPSHVAAIHAAVEAGDAGRLFAAAHTFKGVAVYLSAPFLVDAAAGLETIGRGGTPREAAGPALARLDRAVAELVSELAKASRSPAEA